MKRILTTLSQKWPEYLLEIIVITAGIIGALALNNWNDERKSRIKEIELLSNLKNDFLMRLDKMKDIQLVRSSIIEMIDTRYMVANGEKINYSNEEMDRWLSYLYISYRFNDEFSSLDLLFSSGGLNEISNQKLKERLIKWPWMVQEMIEEQNRIETQLSDVNEVLSLYVSASNLYRSFPFPNMKMAGDLSSDYIKSDYQPLMSDRRFFDLIAHKRAYLAFNVRDGQNLIDLGNQIVVLIDLEIENQ